MIEAPTAADREVDLEEQANFMRLYNPESWVAGVIRRCAAAERELDALRLMVKLIYAELDHNDALFAALPGPLKVALASAMHLVATEPAPRPSWRGGRR